MSYKHLVYKTLYLISCSMRACVCVCVRVCNKWSSRMLEQNQPVQSPNSIHEKTVSERLNNVLEVTEFWSKQKSSNHNLSNPPVLHMKRLRPSKVDKVAKSADCRLWSPVLSPVHHPVSLVLSSLG